MDDSSQIIKYDLRETRFSQNLQHSTEEPYQTQDLWKGCQGLNSISSCTHLFGIKNSDQQKWISKKSDFHIYAQEAVQKQYANLWDSNHKKIQQDSVSTKITKGSENLPNQFYRNNNQLLIPNQKRFKLSNTQQKIKNFQQSSESSDSEDVFSEKLSLIRSLEQKISSLHQKIQFSSNPINAYFQECKLSLEKQFDNFWNSEVYRYENQKLTKYDTQNLGELNQISPTFSSRNSLVNSYLNISLESESMLLDRDSQIIENQILAKKMIGSMFSEQPQVQIVETIRFIEVPYLIEVNKEDDKIVSKKSFYFEENEDIYSTFEEFKHKQLGNESLLNPETKINDGKKTINENCQKESSALDQNNANINQVQIEPKRQRVKQGSILSVNESNRTFDNEIKEKIHDTSFNYDQSNHQILSKLYTQNNQSEVQELEERIKFLQMENSELKEKVKAFALEKQVMELERQELAEQLVRLSELEEIYEHKLIKYRNRIQNLQEEFAYILLSEQTELKEQYERRIEQFQNEQSEYANRIIAFEEMFEEQKVKEERFIEIIERQSEQIQDLQKACQYKDGQIETEIMKRRQVEGYVMQREQDLKKIIENQENKNMDLKHLKHQMQLRYESEGFYILNEQALELKKALEKKEIIHSEELEKLQSRYSELIEKYQIELESMKRALGKARLNKSVSFSCAQDHTLNSINFGP